MKIQSRTLKLMTWFLVGVLLALMVVACGGDGPDQTMPGEPAHLSAREDIDSTPGITPQVRATPTAGEEAPTTEATQEAEPIGKSVEKTPTTEATQEAEPIGKSVEKTPTTEATQQAESIGKAEEQKLMPTPGGKAVDTYETTRQRNMAAISRAERLRPERERIEAIVDKYEDLFRRQPGLNGYGVVSVSDENGQPTDKMVIEILVTKKVDQSTLPPEDRIPDCLEGVPVVFREGPGGVLTSEPIPDSNTEESNGRD